MNDDPSVRTLHFDHRALVEPAFPFGWGLWSLETLRCPQQSSTSPAPSSAELVEIGGDRRITLKWVHFLQTTYLESQFVYFSIEWRSHITPKLEPLHFPFQHVKIFHYLQHRTVSTTPASKIVPHNPPVWKVRGLWSRRLSKMHPCAADTVGFQISPVAESDPFVADNVVLPGKGFGNSWTTRYAAKLSIDGIV